MSKLPVLESLSGKLKKVVASEAKKTKWWEESKLSKEEINNILGEIAAQIDIRIIEPGMKLDRMNVDDEVDIMIEQDYPQLWDNDEDKDTGDMVRDICNRVWKYYKNGKDDAALLITESTAANPISRDKALKVLSQNGCEPDKFTKKDGQTFVACIEQSKAKSVNDWVMQVEKALDASGESWQWIDNGKKDKYWFAEFELIPTINEAAVPDAEQEFEVKVDAESPVDQRSVEKVAKDVGAETAWGETLFVKGVANVRKLVNTLIEFDVKVLSVLDANNKPVDVKKYLNRGHSTGRHSNELEFANRVRRNHHVNEEDNGGETTGLTDEPETKYIYVIDLDERGDFRAHVESKHDDDVFSIDDIDDLQNLIDDGFMKNKEDVDGLHAHLVDLGFINKDDILEEGMSGDLSEDLIDESMKKYEVTVSVRDARKANELVHDSPRLRKGVKNDGSTVFIAKNEDIYDEMVDIFNTQSIEMEEQVLAPTNEAGKNPDLYISKKANEENPFIVVEDKNVAGQFRSILKKAGIKSKEKFAPFGGVKYFTFASMDEMNKAYKLYTEASVNEAHKSVPDEVYKVLTDKYKLSDVLKRNLKKVVDPGGREACGAIAAICGVKEETIEKLLKGIEGYNQWVSEAAVNEEKLIKGKDLTPEQKKQVLAAFVHRNTKENEKVSKRINPTAQITQNDEEWVNSHSFHFTQDGKRLSGRKNHAEPEYLAESRKILKRGILNIRK